MPRPSEKRDINLLADDVAKGYLNFAKLVKNAGTIENLTIMQLINATDELVDMKANLLKLIKSLEATMRIKVIENEQFNVNVIEEPSSSLKKIKLKPKGE